MKPLLITTIVLAVLSLITYALAANILTTLDREIAADYTPEYSLRIVEGDTLWSIARALNQHHYKNRRDPRQIIYEITQLNPGIDPGALRIGQTVYLPAPYINPNAIVGIPEKS